MSLVNCPECGREVSDKAPACIFCGCPLATDPRRDPAGASKSPQIAEVTEESKKSTSKLKRTLIILVSCVAIIIGAVFYFQPDRIVERTSIRNCRTLSRMPTFSTFDDGMLAYTYLPQSKDDIKKTTCYYISYNNVVFGERTAMFVGRRYAGDNEDSPSKHTGESKKDYALAREIFALLKLGALDYEDALFLSKRDILEKLN